MKDILFRGKRVDNGDWVYGGPIFYDSGLVVMCKQYIRNENVIPETVGQYTGLTDKNDNMIFEGDIVKVKITQAEDKQTYGDCEYKIGVIVYSEDFALFTCKNNFMNFINWAFNDYEVIGNIHDNPELLKEYEK